MSQHSTAQHSAGRTSWPRRAQLRPAVGSVLQALVCSEPAAAASRLVNKTAVTQLDAHAACLLYTCACLPACLLCTRVDKGFVAQVADVIGGRQGKLNVVQQQEAEKKMPLEVKADVKHTEGAWLCAESWTHLKCTRHGKLCITWSCTAVRHVRAAGRRPVARRCCCCCCWWHAADVAPPAPPAAAALQVCCPWAATTTLTLAPPPSPSCWVLRPTWTCSTQYLGGSGPVAVSLSRGFWCWLPGA